MCCCPQELAGLAEWQLPQAGMFLWIKLLKPPADEDKLIAQLREHRVSVVLGAAPVETNKFLFVSIHSIQFLLLDFYYSKILYDAPKSFY